MQRGAGRFYRSAVCLTYIVHRTNRRQMETEADVDTKVRIL